MVKTDFVSLMVLGASQGIGGAYSWLLLGASWICDLG